MPLYTPFWRPFKKNGGHFQSSTSISETKRRRTFNIDPTCFVGCRFQKKYCRIHNAFVSAILAAILKNGGHIQSNTIYLGNYETENRHSGVYIIYQCC